MQEIAFSAYGDTKHQLPGLVQTFIQMLNSVTLSGRGFSTLDVPILTNEQSNVLAAWYFAVVRDVGERQNNRQKQIYLLEKELAEFDLDDKTRRAKTKELQDKLAMQDKETLKYTEYFRKSFGRSLEEQNAALQELRQLETRLLQPSLTKVEQRKLQKQQGKLKETLIFSQGSTQQKLELFKQSEGDPFKFVRLDEQQNPDKFKQIYKIAKNFTKIATDQINSTRGDIFTQCIREMYRLLETEPNNSLPQPLLTEEPILGEMRSPGDDSKEFCYSCGIKLDPKNARWQVLRFMFERPSQRRQSASSEGRPHICASCSALAFASPLKVTDESIILQLKSLSGSTISELKIKDYLRMLTNKEMHLSAGRYLILSSERTNTGEIASQKMGQVQYALAKAASIFPVEVLADFEFWLITQGSQKILLANRHLILIKGLMDSYGQSIINADKDVNMTILGKRRPKPRKRPLQSIINADKDVNMTLGDAIRYIQQDLPYLADYILAKPTNYSNVVETEKNRKKYWEMIRESTMNKERQLWQKATLYEDVAALTGLTYAFAQSFKRIASECLSKEDAERELSKLIEKVEDGHAFFYFFCDYYKPFEEVNRTITKVQFYRNPDCSFIYDRLKELLAKIEVSISEREEIDKETQQARLNIFAEDITRVYDHFIHKKEYLAEKDWKNLTYNLKLSLYTRFPELLTKAKTKSEKK
ncbi:hypothetical protein [Chroococcidiopsis sp. CCALA 051]|uniref:hypothetical protein n=1 Tax=Chroococcidiopsis sp. CCALA 051 TaxID=869949 RepID=UPI001E5E87D1|nr:hypothetical protein [Chroococcidiopsis sp. CCALA 051]